MPLLRACIPLALLLLAGCCGAPSLDFVLEPRQVTVRTVPAGAEVVQLQPLEQDAVVLGTSPLEAITVTVMDKVSFDNLVSPSIRELTRHAGTVVVRISKPGYEVFEGALRTDATQLVEHRIVLKKVP
ncbi:MAG: hypothetical protein HN904_17395 [Victivallales bacterium]|nr:hypothetical protein [Victivallales bacterium]